MTAQSLNASHSRYSEVLDWLNHDASIIVSGDEFKKDSGISRCLRSSKTDRKKIGETAQLIIRLLASSQTVDADLQGLAERFVKNCTKKKKSTKEIDLLDRQLHAKDGAYITSNNKKDFNRWKQWGFKPEIFQEHYAFAKFLLDSPLGSQMKIFSDSIILMDGQPGIIVEGKWASFEEIKNRFETTYSSRYSQKFMRDKETKNIYTFLSNGQGLQKHNPYEAEKLTPILKLSEEEYQRALTTAQQFVREGEEDLSPEEANKDRTFIFQIVGTYFDGANTNASEFLTKSKHMWLRLIAGKDDPQLGIKKGDVIETGYEWDSPYKLPALTTQGRFRSIDIWNYVRPKQRVVTNIAITQKEMHKVVDYISAYQKQVTENDQKIAFNYFRQNCSAFVHYAAKQAGIRLPTKILLTDLIKEISPDWMQAIGRGVAKAAKAIRSGLQFSVNWLPSPLLSLGRSLEHSIYKIASAVFDALGAFGIGFFSFFLGGAIGQQSLAFSKHPQNKKVMTPTLLQVKNFFSMKKFYYYLPGKLQEWQRLQPSTVIYDRPVAISITPPAKA